MIEIVIGIVVLILVIVGIAQLKRGGGSKTVVDIQDIANKTLAWKKALNEALYKSENLGAVLMYVNSTVEDSKRALSAIYGQRKILRERVDMTDARLQDYADLFDDIPVLANTLRLAYRKLREGKISQEQFRNYLAGELKDLESMTKRHHYLRHA